MDDAAVITGLHSLAHDNGVKLLAIDGLTRLRGGNSSEIWSCDCQWADGDDECRRSLIVRSGSANEFSFAGRDAEYQVLTALAPSEIPLPRIYWFDLEGRHLGRQTMVMERCPGSADRMLLTAQNRFGLDEAQRVQLAQRMIELLGRIHAAKTETVQLDAAHQNPAAERLRRHDEAIAALELEPLPELRIASWWLWQHLPHAPERRTFIHGDYRPANMLIQDARISAILDWEFAGLGDPMEDLGWYLSPYYATEHLIPGAFEQDDVIEHYERTTGTSVDCAVVRFWSVFAIYKLAYMTIAALRWMTQSDASRMTTSARFILKPLLDAIAAAEGNS